MEWLSSVVNKLSSTDLFTQFIVSFITVIFVATILSHIKFAYRHLATLRRFKLFCRELNKQDRIVVSELADLERAWTSRHLVITQSDAQNVLEKRDGRYLTRMPLMQTLLPDPLMQGKSIPALLTSIGVAGTFLGITVGLAGFDMKAVGQDSSSLVTSAIVLLEGMKTAFYTSLAGLASSAILMMVTQVVSKLVRGRLSKVNQLLQQQLIEESAVDYLKIIAENNAEKSNSEAQQNSAQAMLTLSEKLGVFFDKMEGVTESFNGERMADRISDAVGQTMEKSVVPVLAEFKNELETLRTIKEDNHQELLTNLVNTIKQDLITPVTVELSKTTDAVNASNTVSEKLNENVTKVLSEVARTVETIDSFNQSTMQKLQEFAKSLQHVLTGFKDDTQSTMQDITHKVEEVLNVSIKGMEAQRDAFDASAQRAADTFEGMGDKLEEALNKRAQSENNLFSEIESRIQSLLKGTSDNFDKQTNTMQDITHKVEEVLNISIKGMEAQRDAFDTSAQRAADAFAGMGTQLEEALNKRAQSESNLFSEIENRIQSLLQGNSDNFDKQTITMQDITQKVEEVLNISIKGMETQRDAFDASAQRAADAFEGMGDKLEGALNKRAQSESNLFSEVEGRIQSLLNSTSDNFDKQTIMLENTGLEASSLMQSAREELEKGLGDIDTKVTGMSRTVQQELESFRIQYQDNLKTFFNDQNNLLEDSLGKQRNNLVEVVDRFKQVFEEEYQTRHGLLKELTEQHDHLQKSANTIQQLAKAIGLTETAAMSELQDIAHTMGRHVGELKKEYMHASSAFKEVTEGLPKAMENYFKQANNSTETFFQSFDQAASKIHNRLAQAADFLVDAKLQDNEFEKAEAL
jgi:AraC-like DNA-binding protein